MRPSILILHAPGTNRDKDAALACEMAGGISHIVHIDRLFSKEVSLGDYQMLVFPGGFSFGDDLGSGTLFAAYMQAKLGEELVRFVESKKPVLGICNGFQTLVKLGLLPGRIKKGSEERNRNTTLAHNASARFECRWVTLLPNNKSKCVFTKDLQSSIECPVAHGEGRVSVSDEGVLADLQHKGLDAIHYEVEGAKGYPQNPNGSVANIAGLCSEMGNVFGLMPHPENHVHALQYPHTKKESRLVSGLPLFEQGIAYAAQC